MTQLRRSACTPSRLLIVPLDLLPLLHNVIELGGVRGVASSRERMSRWDDETATGDLEGELRTLLRI